jgi:hypothetical protein
MQGRHVRQAADSHPLLKVNATPVENRTWRMKQARECTTKTRACPQAHQQQHALMLLRLLPLLPAAIAVISAV